MTGSKREWVLPLSVALLSFLGALGGVVAGSVLDQKNWERRAEAEWNKVVLEKRVDLIERTVLLFNRKPIVVGLRGALDAEKKVAHLISICSSGGEEYSACPPLESDALDRAERYATQITSFTAEFSALLGLNVIYFGPKTREAAGALVGLDPWTADAALFQAVVDAMAAELYHF